MSKFSLHVCNLFLHMYISFASYASYASLTLVFIYGMENEKLRQQCEDESECN